jgi:hypothetical protein
MINDTYFDNLIGKRLEKEQFLKEELHISSGLLSASMLGKPLQWQLLKKLGVPSKPFDEYTLRKFLRGQQIEDWFLSNVETEDTQKVVNYRNCIGYVDALIKYDERIPELKGLVIPHEVKSVTNAKFRRITKTKEADPQHSLQAGLYALALKSSYYAIDYIASDDLRVETYIYKTEKIKEEIDKIISEYDNALRDRKVPVFTPRYDWQKNLQYSDYPDWQELTEEQIEKRISEEGFFWS